MEKIKLTVLSCRRCDYEWIPRRPTPPKVCPKCKRRDWNVKK